MGLPEKMVAQGTRVATGRASATERESWAGKVRAYWMKRYGYDPWEEDRPEVPLPGDAAEEP